MIGFCPLASGSKGNCIYLGTKTTKILIDAGISVKMIRNRLAAIGVELEQIDAVLVTHEHSDHIKALEILGCKLGIPIFANSDTAKAIFGMLDECPKFKIFEAILAKKTPKDGPFHRGAYPKPALVMQEVYFKKQSIGSNSLEKQSTLLSLLAEI